MNQLAKSSLFLLPLAAVLFLWAAPGGEPAPTEPGPVVPSTSSSAGREAAEPVPSVQREAAGRRLYDLMPGEAVELACSLDSTTVVRPGVDAAPQQIQLGVDATLVLTAKARRGAEWIAEALLVGPRVTLQAGSASGETTRLTQDLRVPWLVSFGAAGEVRGYRFAPAMLAEHRNVLRALFTGLRTPLGADGAWRGPEGDAGGISEVTSSREAGAGVAIVWQRTGYAAQTDAQPVPQLEGHGRAVAAEGACWWSESSYRETQRMAVPQAGAEIEASLQVNGRLLRMTGAAAPDAASLWDGAWEPASGAHEGEAGRAASEGARFERELRGRTLQDLVAELAQLAGAGESASVDAFTARERLAWLLRLRPELTAELQRMLLDPRLDARLAAQLAGAAGAAATVEAQRMLLALSAADSLPRGRRNGALVALVQVEAPAAEVATALQQLAARGDGDRTLRGTSLLVLGAQASRADASPELFARLLAFEAAAQRDGLLIGWLGALGNAGRADAIAPAARHLRDEREPVRVASLSALRSVASAQATDLLLHHARADEAPLVRSKAVELLGARADLRALAAIERALGDGDEQVRRTAVLALRDRSEPAVEQWLARAAATDPAAGVRRVAAEVLGSRVR